MQYATPEKMFIFLILVRFKEKVVRILSGNESLLGMSGRSGHGSYRVWKVLAGGPIHLMEYSLGPRNEQATLIINTREARIRATSLRVDGRDVP